MNIITVRLAGGQTMECPAGTLAGSLPGARAAADGLPSLAALVNNNVSSLSYPLPTNCAVEFLSMANPHGWRIYRQSLCFLLAKAVRELFPGAQFSVEHSFDPGLYCRFRHGPEDRDGISAPDVARIESRLRDFVARNLPIERRKIAYAEAVAEFEAAGQMNTLNLLRFRNPPHVVLHWCDGFSDLAHGPLAPSTGPLGLFDLIPYPPGFVLQVPRRAEPGRVAPFEDQPHLFRIFQEHIEWGRILGVHTVGRLNEIVAGGQIDDFIRTAEALHEKKLARIADQIAAARDRVRAILIAGPSCSGKTTFAKRLAVHLRVNGLRPVTLGTDDYFVGDERNPLDEEGKPDYEHLEAVDLELFNRQLASLARGEAVRPPRFNFPARKREWSADPMRMEADQVLIVEGIHALNPRLTERLPAESKFRIYVSALTQLSMDLNNRVSTTDNRLMRRLVRDDRFRGHAPLDTLQRWPSVRRGERQWIFPFQREADATFNSALDYELAVLKPRVEPLLMQIKPTHPEYAEARRLSEFLLNFLPAPDKAVLGHSILREYIGGSDFAY